MLAGGFLHIHRLSIAVAASVTIAQPAPAAEDIRFGPAPEWVVPSEFVGETVAPEGSGQLPVRIVLSESQVRLEPGRQTTYLAFAIRFQNSQGLSAGDLSLVWRPEFDELTVHQVHIRRGDEIIDVLGEGQTFTTLRREQSLEQAMLDGVLTANMFPAGLEVGDTLEVAYSAASSNPVLAGHAETAIGPFTQPADRISVRLQWPERFGLKLATTRGLPELRRGHAGAMQTAALELADVRSITIPDGAPSRYFLPRMIEASDFASWQDVAGLFVPLYREASRIPAQGRLRERIEDIRAATDDPERRAERALALVQNQVRYVALAMGSGGLIPADAETTWSRRYGDCKAKTAVLLGILGELGITAEPVFVNSLFGDALPGRLPMVGAFDHVLVRASIGGRTYWLDGTRSGDNSLARLETPAFGWGLPIVGEGAELVPMVPAPLAMPSTDIAIRMDASGGLHAPVPTQIEIVMRGDLAFATNNALSQLVGDTREQSLEQYWRNLYSFVTSQQRDARFDAERGELVFSMSGTAEMDWSSNYYETDNTRLGYDVDFERVTGPDSDAPFALSHPFFDRTQQTIVLPAGFDRSLIEGGEYDEVVAGVEYRRTAGMEGNVFTATRSARSVAGELPYEEALASEKRLSQLWEDHLHLKLPARYRLSKTDVAALARRETSDVDDLVREGNALLDAGEYAAALVKFDKVTELDPKDIRGWANKAVTHAQMNKIAQAAAAAERADAIDPKNYVTWHARGIVAEKQGDAQAALEAFDAALSSKPDSIFALEHRATSNFALGRDEAGLADATRLVEVRPEYSTGYLRKAYGLNQLQRPDDVQLALAQMIAARPDDPNMQALASEAFTRFGLDDRAEAAMNAALESGPSAYSLTLLANRRSVGETDLKLEELGRALKLDPDYIPALVSRANTLWMDYDYEAALADADRAIALQPGSFGAYDVKARILLDQDRRTAAGETADAAVAANPQLPRAYAFAIDMHRRLGNDARADELLEQQLQAWRRRNVPGQRLAQSRGPAFAG